LLYQQAIKSVKILTLVATIVCISDLQHVIYLSFYVVLDRIWFGNSALYAIK